MAKPTETLDELLHQAVKGKSAALESLLLHFHDALLQHIQKLVAGQPTGSISAEDVLQETLIAAFRGIRTLQPNGPDAFFAWLKTIARTRWLNMVKAAQTKKRGGRQKIQRPADPDATATSIMQHIAGPDATPSRLARRNEAIAVIVQAIAELDTTRRQVLDLHYAQGLSAPEVAAQLGQTPGSVKMVIHRSIKQLRTLITRKFGDFSVGA